MVTFCPRGLLISFVGIPLTTGKTVTAWKDEHAKPTTALIGRHLLVIDDDIIFFYLSGCNFFWTCKTFRRITLSSRTNTTVWTCEDKGYCVWIFNCLAKAMVLIELSLRQRYGETFIAHFFNVRRFHFQSRINPTGCISLNASVIASAIILWSERINTVYCYFTESSNIPKFSGNLQLHVGVIDWTHATALPFSPRMSISMVPTDRTPKMWTAWTEQQ